MARIIPHRATILLVLVAVLGGPSASYAFGYDARGRLTELVGPEVKPWDIDAGNVLVSTDKAEYEHDRRHRRTAKIELEKRADGSRVERRTEYDWDCRDRLREVRLPDGQSVRFRYDAFGRRVSKDVLPPGRGHFAKSLVMALEKGVEALPKIQRIEFLWDGDVLAADIGAVASVRAQSGGGGGEVARRGTPDDPGIDGTGAHISVAAKIARECTYVVPGETIVYQCATCRALLSSVGLASSISSGMAWSDGYEAPFLQCGDPQLIKCGHCGTVQWKQDLVVHGRLPPLDFKGAHRHASDEAARLNRAVSLSWQDHESALTRPGSTAREIYLRRRLRQELNHPQRKGGRCTPELEVVAKDNASRLIALLEEAGDPSDVLERADLRRFQGDLDGAKRLLAQAPAGANRVLREAIADALQEGRRTVVPLIEVEIPRPGCLGRWLGWLHARRRNGGAR